jgi:hypothetical protein
VDFCQYVLQLAPQKDTLGCLSPSVSLHPVAFLQAVSHYYGVPLGPTAFVNEAEASDVLPVKMSSIIFLWDLPPHRCQPAASSSGQHSPNHSKAQTQYLQATFLSVHLLVLGTLSWTWSSAQSICVGVLLPLTAFR